MGTDGSVARYRAVDVRALARGAWKCWRLWRRFFVVSAMLQAEYRVNLWLSAFQVAAALCLTLALYLAFYRFADTVAGWSRAEALLLLGVFWLFDGVWSAVFTPNLRRLGSLIQDGDLDFVLLRPVSSQFLVSCGSVDLKALANLPVGLAIVGYAGNQAGVVWGLGPVIGALAFGLCGLALMYALRFAIGSVTFWALRVGDLYSLPYTLYDGARFPVAYFKTPMREVLTYVVPAAFATTFPAQALLGTADYRMLPVGMALAVGALFGANRFWRHALRRYSSASS
jgi:ABC-2 type transport system permease protein